MVAWRLLENRTARSSSGRTGRGTTCWFGVRFGSVIPSRLVRRPLDALSGVSRHGWGANLASTFPRGSHRPALASGRPDATLPGLRREGGSVARVHSPSGTPAGDR